MFQNQKNLQRKNPTTSGQNYLNKILFSHDRYRVREKKEKKEYFKKGIYRLKRHVLPFKKEIIWISIFGIISAIANGVVPYITGFFFDELIVLAQGNQNYFYTWPLWVVLIIAWLIVQIFANGFDWLVDNKRVSIDAKVHLQLVYNGFRKLFRLPINFHKNEKINEHLDKISMAGWRTSSLVRTITETAPQIIEFYYWFYFIFNYK